MPRRCEAGEWAELASFAKSYETGGFVVGGPEASKRGGEAGRRAGPRGVERVEKVVSKSWNSYWLGGTKGL